MLQAAELGDRQAMVYMAKAYESGSGLGFQRYGTVSGLKKTRITTWNLPGPRGTRDCINIACVQLLLPSKSGKSSFPIFFEGRSGCTQAT